MGAGDASRRRRAALFVLLFGAVLAVGPLVMSVPSERRFIVTAADPRVDRMTVSWRDQAGNLLRRVALTSPYDAGLVPLRRTFRLAPGRYRIDIETQIGAEQAAVTRVVDIEDDTTEVRIAPPPSPP
ncbi:MAG: hypothetical protein AAGN82_01460 [Myxococcota bacterium]